MAASLDDVGGIDPLALELNSPAEVGQKRGAASAGKSSHKRPKPNDDTLWAAWFFFDTYYKTVYKDDDPGAIDTTVFEVQFAMENCYMYAFRDRQDLSLGPGQLNSWISGKQIGESPYMFPFAVKDGYIRCHRLQNKKYRNLKNPQCITGIRKVVDPPVVAEEDARRWYHLTGRETSEIPGEEAEGYVEWRPVPNPSDHTSAGGRPIGKVQQLDSNSDRGRWLSQIGGVLSKHFGPVTAAKTIYEDSMGYLVKVSLPYVDKRTVKITWRNTTNECIIKVTATSIGGSGTYNKDGRIYKCTDPQAEIPRNGTLTREIHLPMLLPPKSALQASFDPVTAGMEILVPKLTASAGDFEIPVTIL
ncbi:hypothetical protein KFL_004320020 [Klebsormidium nitens]|uniref:Uncharacterized protein n=1 Tax=Klebsormidium nitens TaxID=105231 RepID=A0A1Y1IID0_KLENI|nr:hypothetical protein KFL_004320020 [Klebsormidium nitens]|eukprot:GAQ88476.1 hypothetical protein KFL_004320020 [Klebsormidium nitens]